MADDLSGFYEQLQGLITGLPGLMMGAPQYNINTALGPIRRFSPTADEVNQLAADLRQYANRDLNQGEIRTFQFGTDEEKALLFSDLREQIDTSVWRNRMADNFLSNFTKLVEGSPYLDRLRNELQASIEGTSPTIKSLVAQGQGEAARYGQSAIDQINTELAGRGLTRSGVATDIVTRARENTAQFMSDISSKIKGAAREQGLNLQTNLETALTGLKGGAGQFAEGIRLGAPAPFDISRGFNVLGELGSRLAETNFLNQASRQQALQSLMQQQQQQFENALGLVGMFKGNKSGGSSGGSSGGGLGPFALGLTLGL